MFGNAAPDSGNSEILAMAGTDDQKDQYLHPLLNGDLRSAFSMTEPETAGSDPTLLQTTAVLDGDEWVINGHKWFSSNASVADFLIVMAVTDPEAHKYQRASMLIVPADAPGVTIVRDIATMEHPYEHYGRIGGHSEILYEDVRVPKDALLGPRGAGFLIAQQRLGPGRIHHCMRWLGVSRRAFDMLCEYSLTREAFGSKLAEKQTIQNWIADSAAQMQAARLMTLHAAWKMDAEGASAARQEIALIKFFGAGVMHDVVDRALQIHGSLGYSTDLPLEQMYRFARAARLYDGARRGAPPERRAAHPARLRGAGGRRADRARPDPPRGGRARALRRPARGRHLQRLRVLLGVLLAALACAGCGSDGAQQHARVDRFDGDRGRSPTLRREVELGPRPAGSPVLRKLARAAQARAPARALRGRPRPPGLRNVVGRIPGKRPAIVVAAHYDTKDLPGFVGANDGAGGTAAVLELARALRHAKRPKGAPRAALRAVRRRGGDRRRPRLPRHRRARLEGLRAPPRRASCARWSCSTSSPTRTCGIPREAGSDAKLWARLRRAAKRVGVGGDVPGRAVAARSSTTTRRSPRRGRARRST